MSFIAALEVRGVSPGISVCEAEAVQLPIERGRVDSQDLGMGLGQPTHHDQ